MVKSFNIKVAGVQRTTALMLLMNKKIKANIAKGMSKIGKDVKEEVKESIAGRKSEPKSVDTGEFLASVESTNTEDTATIKSDVKQSVFMEYGTVRIPERRHFRNSLNRKKGDIKNILKGALKIS